MFSSLHSQCSPFTDNWNFPPASSFIVLCAHPPVSVWINQENQTCGRGGGDSMQEISYIGDERTKKQQSSGGWASLAISKGPTPGLEGLREETPLPEGLPSRSESGSLAAVRVGTTEQMSRLCRLLLSFMPVTLLCHLHCVHLLLTQHLSSPPTKQ